MTARCDPVLRQALLDFQQSPGNYAVHQGQPRVLFGRVRDVLQIAGDRQSGGALQDAAAFFLRTALLRPAADHYQLLGLRRDAQGGSIKENYRLLMRIVHPDFADAGRSAPWPTDAAARLNRAYEVLSTPEKRAAYDEQNRDKPPAPLPIPPASAARPRPRRYHSRSILKALAMGLGGSGLALLGALHWMGASDDGQELVQRRDEAASTAASAGVTAEGPAPSAAGPVVHAPGTADLPGASMPTAQESAAPAKALDAKTSGQRAGGTRLTQAEAGSPTFARLSRGVSIALGEQQPRRETAASGFAVPAAALAAASPAPAPAPPAGAAAEPPTPAPAPLPTKPREPDVSLAAAQPALSRFLQSLESGSPDRVARLLEQELRHAGSAAAFLRQYAVLADGARPLAISNVQLRSEPHDGHLLVTGMVSFRAGERHAGGTALQLPLHVEFSLREGQVVMSRIGKGDER